MNNQKMEAYKILDTVAFDYLQFDSLDRYRPIVLVNCHANLSPTRTRLFGIYEVFGWSVEERAVRIKLNSATTVWVDTKWCKQLI